MTTNFNNNDSAIEYIKNKKNTEYEDIIIKLADNTPDNPYDIKSFFEFQAREKQKYKLYKSLIDKNKFGTITSFERDNIKYTVAYAEDGPIIQAYRTLTQEEIETNDSMSAFTTYVGNFRSSALRIPTFGRLTEINMHDFVEDITTTLTAGIVNGGLYFKPVESCIGLERYHYRDNGYAKLAFSQLRNQFNSLLELQNRTDLKIPHNYYSASMF